MHRNMRRAVHTALLTGGLVVAGAVSAYATDDDGLLSGLGIEAPVDVSVDVTGLAAGVLGDASTTTAPAGPEATAPTAAVGGGSSEGVASGTAVAAPVSIPVDIDGVALGVLGDATTTATGTTPTTGTTAPTATVESGDTDGIATGTGIAAPVSIPVDIDGVALGVLGDATTTATGDPAPTGTTAPTATVESGDTDGIATGTGIAAPVSIPVDIDGLALGVLGDATTGTGTGTTPTTGESGAPTATVGGGDSDGPLAGTGVAAPISVPVTIGDVALGLLGDASTTSTGTRTAGTATDAPTATADGGDSDGLGSGTSVAAPVSVPVTIGDVALGLLGDASTTSTGTRTAGTDAPTATIGGGDSAGLLSTLGIALPVSVPITIGDLALGVVGEAAVVDPGTGTDGTGTDPGTTDPGTTGPGTTDPGTTGPGSTPGADDGTTTVADVTFTSGVLAAADLAAALDRSAPSAVTLPAALAPTGGPAALTVLAALGLVGLGLLLRRIPRVVLT